ncbi:MAG: A24 family peptidase [Alphaproteobacteria bacterium]
MQSPDPIYLHLLNPQEVENLINIFIDTRSRSVLGHGFVWDILRLWDTATDTILAILQKLASQPNALTILALAAIGAILASYADQLAWRLARLEDAEDFGLPLSEQEQKLIQSKRSLCPPCGRIIATHHNIPILSWILMKGKCSCQNTKIPPRHLIVEIAGAILLPALFMLFGPTLAFFGASIYVTIAAAASIADFDRRILPNRLNYAILWTGLTFAALSPANRGPDANTHWLRQPLELPLVSAVIAVVSIWIFLYIFKIILGLLYRKRDAFGWGDVKFLVAIAAWVGPAGLVLSILFAGITASIYSIIARQREFPAGPHLALGGLLAMLPQVQELITLWHSLYYTDSLFGLLEAVGYDTRR